MLENVFFLSEGREVAVDGGVKYVEVSAELDHNVDRLLVGVVKQSRLRRQPQHLVKNNSSRSAGSRVRGLLDKVLGQDQEKSEACDNLNVI